MAAGLDARGRPVAWTHRIVGPAILARYLPPAFRNGIDLDGVDAAVQLLYDIPAIQVEFVRHEERSEEHTSELQSLAYLVCRLLLEKKKIQVSQLIQNQRTANVETDR